MTAHSEVVCHSLLQLLQTRGAHLAPVDQVVCRDHCDLMRPLAFILQAILSTIVRSKSRPHVLALLLNKLMPTSTPNQSLGSLGDQKRTTGNFDIESSHLATLGSLSDH